MAPWNTDHSEILEKMAALSEADEITIFDDDEAKALKQMAAMWRGLESFGVLAGVVRKILVYVGWAVGFYLLIKGGLTDWIKGLMP